VSRQNPWAKHFQTVWHERAGDPRLPAWLRVAALAYGSHQANGHAPFKPGEIALILASVDTETGEVKSMNKHNVQRSINKAVEYGWLVRPSGSLCLVVPGHAIQGGLGRAANACPLHGRKQRVSQKVTHSRPLSESLSDTPVSHSVTTDNALTCGNVSALYDSSIPHPGDQGSQAPNDPRRTA
jgi:hypothetical protein